MDEKRKNVKQLIRVDKISIKDELSSFWASQTASTVIANLK